MQLNHILIDLCLFQFISNAYIIFLFGEYTVMSHSLSQFQISSDSVFWFVFFSQSHTKLIYELTGGPGGPRGPKDP